jgi:septation ring formation regulator EzrA
MRESWTDERLDDFTQHVDQRFDAVDQRFDAVDQRFDAVNQRFDAVDQRFERVETDLRALRAETKSGFETMQSEFNARFDALNRTLLQIGGGLVATLLAGVLAAIATQL